MTDFKGNLVEVKKIPEGAVFQLTPEVGPQFGIPPKSTRIGILRYMEPSWNDAEIVIGAHLWDPEKKSFALHRAALKKTEMLKHLSGTMVGSLLSRFLKSIKADTVPGLVNGPVNNISIGSDPEFFIMNGDAVVPAWELYPGKKGMGNQNPYFDGVQGEFKIFSGGCLDGLTSCMAGALSSSLVQALKKHPKAKLSIKNVVETPLSLLKTWKPEQVELGCEPSLNIYDEKQRKFDADLIPFRPAGGHLHFGIGKQTPTMLNELIKCLDAVLAVSCVSLFAGMDDPRRRSLYGRAGEYRLPAHGVEYRVLSNAWLTSPPIMQLIWDLARRTRYFSRGWLRGVWDADEVETRDVINNTDVAGARKIIKRNRDILEGILKGGYTPHAAERAGHIILNGIESMVKDPFDVEGNWGIEKKSGMLTAFRGTRWSDFAARK